MFPMASGHMQGTAAVENMISLGILTIFVAFLGMVINVLSGLKRKKEER